MAIAYRCLHCGASSYAPKELAGRLIDCPKCKGPVEIPGAEWEGPPPPKASPPVIPPPPPAPQREPTAIEVLQSLDQRMKAVEEHGAQTRSYTGWILAIAVFFFACSIIEGCIYLVEDDRFEYELRYR